MVPRGVPLPGGAFVVPVVGMSERSPMGTANLPPVAEDLLLDLSGVEQLRVNARSGVPRPGRLRAEWHVFGPADQLFDRGVVPIPTTLR